MNGARWSWLLVAAAAVTIPSCLLVQPLDDAKSDSADGGGDTSSGGSPSSGGKLGAGGKTGSAGKANTGDSGDTGAGDAGDGPGEGGAGATANGGRSGSGATAGSGPANGGGPGSGVDFSLFLGKWYPASGTITTTCTDSGTTTADTPTDYYDLFELGTSSDLLWDTQSSCPLELDVNDRVASIDNYPGQTCTITAQTTNYPIAITYETFDFTVSGDGTTASSSTVVSEYVTDTDGNYVRTCTQDFELKHSRTQP